MPDKPPYIGRFAPSPTGPLHLGSLCTALAGFLDARSCRGLWLLRIDDLDTPRTIKGSADSILKTLEAFALHWDGGAVYQSQYLDVYHDALDELAKNRRLYACDCSRKSLDDGRSCACRGRPILPGGPYSLRIKTDDRVIAFQDALQGLISHGFAGQQDDFILKRKDGIMAYQFAVVIDDEQQQVNHVVRGFDLLDSTPRQIYIRQMLGLATPDYMHVPVIVDEHGYKLSKQTRAAAVDLKNPQATIFRLLTLLRQNPPDALQHAPPTELLDWAIEHWNPALLKDFQAICQSN
jgi:glutamyl-Q tRNA(Asp) synthetase